MDIRIIKSQKGSSYLPLCKGRVLSISDGTKQIGDYLSKRLECYDITENRKEEIVPNIAKYQIWDIRVLQSPEGCCYFTGCHVIEKDQIKVELYRYQEESKKVELLYEEKENILIQNSQKKTVLFVLNENYLLIQYMYVKSNEVENYSGFLDFELKLYSIKEEKAFSVTDVWLSQLGIEQMQIVAKNICAIKTGVNLLEENRYQFLSEREVFPERIGFLNIQQMISDILLKQKNIYMDIIEETKWDKTLLNMRVEEGVLMYSRLSLEEQKEEVIFYNYESKKIDICENMGVSELEQIADTCVIGKVPYIRRKTEEGTYFYNVRKGSSDIFFGKEKQIKEMAHGIAVLEEVKKKVLFFPERRICEVYKLPEKERLLQEKSGVNCVMIPDKETVLLFTN